MKMGDGSDVPRVTCRGACQEGALVVNEVGENQFHKVLRKLCDWRRACGGCIRGTSTEQRLDFGFVSVPKLVSKQFNRCNSVKAAQRPN
jgi:hypothetical protein